MMRRIGMLTLVVALCGTSSAAQEVPVEEVVLDNGMTILLLPRPGDPNVAVGWVAKVGSVYERPGITGVAHLFEHMMFKGTATIGTRNIEQDLQLIAELDRVKAEIRVEEATLLEAHRLGQIEDPDDPALRSARHQDLIGQFDTLLAEQSELIIKEDFSRTYSGQGASGMNAGTSYDYTIYFVNVPANKLELWFWMESDRLLNPVFREFYSEREVVHEERRLRTDSTPTGKFQEQFDALFWQSSPYSWPIVGWPSDLEGITREEALAFFGTYYAPNNLTAALVGDFDPAEAKALGERYFGRLERSERPAPKPRTREMPQLGEKRMTAYAETNPQVNIRYHSVPDGHVDEPPLVVLGQLLNGRTGRLYQALVEDQQVATNASGGQSGQKFEGMFSLGGTAKEGRTPEEVEQALYVEIERLKTEPVGERELQKVKNQNAASNFRGLRSNFGLMNQLLVREAWRGWETINTDPALYEAVTADDIMRVANTYFEPENRAVAIYYRKESDEPPDPRLAGLDDQERQQVSQMMTMIGQMNAEQIGQVMAQLEQMAAQAPPENQDMVAVLLEIVRERQAAAGGGR
ncbi:MAG: pitrilysin family protein [Vicinamibacterales bacterium]|jgi:predicted Zn-dependent peptidase|nr:pitrilysin family protein [Vicinamibacterales bacterium]